jgi:putative molybdopterin biosynthesis protein
LCKPPVDLNVIASHCTGIDLLLGLPADRGFRSKAIWVGSQGRLAVITRGACDDAGIHLLDQETNVYNRGFLPPGPTLLPGHGRMPGIADRMGDSRFLGRAGAAVIKARQLDATIQMVNRNRGSGARILIDRMLEGFRPAGYAIEARSHNAVAASIVQGRADWGILIAPVAATYGLAVVPLVKERFDFLIRDDRDGRPAVDVFRELVDRSDLTRRLAEMGFLVGPERMA